MKARTAVRTCITSVCIESGCGLLCPEDRVGELETAIDKARKLANDFNATAKFSNIRLSLILGRIAATDVEAFRAINGEVRDLMRIMERGIENLDVKAVRDAAAKARKVGEMLTPEAKERVAGAIKLAREAASKIAKAGDTAAMEVDKEAIKAIAKQRTAFLDLEDVGELTRPVVVAAPAVDFDPDAFKYAGAAIGNNVPKAKRAPKRVRAVAAEIEL